jgi:hypothetical protein
MHYKFCLLRPCPSPKCYLVSLFWFIKTVFFSVAQTASHWAGFSSWWTKWHWGRLLSAGTSLSKTKVFWDITYSRLVACQHSVTSQKILTFTSTSVRASDVVGQVGISTRRSMFRCTKLKSGELKNKMYVYILWIILGGPSAVGWGGGKRISVACFWHPRHIHSYLRSCCWQLSFHQSSILICQNLVG